MTRLSLVPLALALAALACLTPAVTPTLVSPAASPGIQETETTLVPAPAGAPTQDSNLVLDIADPEEQDTSPTEQPAGAVYFIPPTGPHCAQVIAPEAVHLRTASTEHSPALDWLRVGEVVTVHLSEGAWSLVTAGGKDGYIKSEFLEEIPCEKP